VDFLLENFLKISGGKSPEKVGFRGDYHKSFNLRKE